MFFVHLVRVLVSHVFCLGYGKSAALFLFEILNVVQRNAVNIAEIHAKVFLQQVELFAAMGLLHERRPQEQEERQEIQRDRDIHHDLFRPLAVVKHNDRLAVLIDLQLFVQ